MTAPQEDPLADWNPAAALAAAQAVTDAEGTPADTGADDEDVHECAVPASGWPDRKLVLFAAVVESAAKGCYCGLPATQGEWIEANRERLGWRKGVA